MPRFFVSQDQISENRIEMTGSDVNHVRNVLRMSVGDDMMISDGEGCEYSCQIASVEKEVIWLDIVEKHVSEVELPAKIILYQGMPKADKMELIIQKAVELGVYAIVPVITRRTVVKLDDKKEEKKRIRWQSIAESAAKQSGRAIIPEVRSSISFEEAVGQCQALDAALIPYEKAEGMQHAREQVKNLHGSHTVGILIGPEGGFEENEIQLASESGIVPVSLGHRILRTETAGMTMLSIIMFELEED